MLVTEHLTWSIPYRTVYTRVLSPQTVDRLLDALVLLLARLHLVGFAWYDCSLSNVLFRRDAGAFAAYLVDAETGELHPRLTDGQRNYDLELAHLNIAGGLMDLVAAADWALSSTRLRSPTRSPNATNDCGRNSPRPNTSTERNAGGLHAGSTGSTTSASTWPNSICGGLPDGVVRIQPKVVDAGYHPGASYGSWAWTWARTRHDDCSTTSTSTVPPPAPRDADRDPGYRCPDQTQREVAPGGRDRGPPVVVRCLRTGDLRGAVTHLRTKLQGRGGVP